MILLQGQGLARTFADEVLFENITIHIQENSRIAIVGRNVYDLCQHDKNQLCFIPDYRSHPVS